MPQDVLKKISDLFQELPQLQEQAEFTAELDQLLHKLNLEKQRNEQTYLDLKYIAHLKGMHFFVDRYQRSYKWTKQQVEALLNDIFQFSPQQDGEFYCLQPIVVKVCNKDDKKYWELIDGQQRLTTIFLVLNYLDQHIYSLRYETRSESAEFLQHHLNDLGRRSDLDYFDFIEQYPQLDNIDNYHFFNAYQTIKSWFEQQKQQQHDICEVWKDKLLNATKVIWYQVKPIEKSSEAEEKNHSIAIFQRLNQGKIALTNAELIKALLLTHVIKGHNLEAEKIRQAEMANQWDLIEHALQDDDFWAFLRPQSDANLYTRIELIFDLIADKYSMHAKHAQANQSHYTFHYYYNLIETNTPIEQIWQDIQQSFYRLMEWFNDDETYHLVGFLLGQKIKTINHLWKLAQNNKLKRDGFINELKMMIAQEVCKIFGEKNFPPQSALNVEEVSYGQDNKNILSLLVLSNIALHRQQKTRLAFKYYYQDGQSHSLEHIHPQNAQYEKYPEIWCAEQQDLLDHLNEHIIPQAQLDELKQLFSNYLSTYDSLHQENYMKKVEQYLASFLDTRKNQLDNLCLLLTVGDNSKLSNHTFFEKRQAIMEFQQQGSNTENTKTHFVPMATQWVFAKYFNPHAQNLLIWSTQDRQTYKQALTSCFEYYFANVAHNLPTIFSQIKV